MIIQGLQHAKKYYLTKILLNICLLFSLHFMNLLNYKKIISFKKKTNRNKNCKV